MDLNSKIAQYLQKNNEADINQITSSIKNLDSGYSTDLHNTIFQIGDGISEEQFIQFVSEASGKDAESIRDDAALLFDILDSDDSSGLLTADEVSFMSDNGQTIDGFEFWNNALSPNTDEIANNLENINTDSSDSDYYSEYADDSALSDESASYVDSESYGDSKTTASSSSEESTTVTESDSAETQAAADVEQTDEAAEAAASDTSVVDEVSSDDTEAESASSSNSAVDFSDATAVKSYLEVFMDSDSGIKTYNQAIDFVKDTLGLSDEAAEQMRQTLLYDGLSDKDKQKVQVLVASGLSYQEAMNALSNNEAIQIDESVLDEEVSAEEQADEKSLSDNQVKVFSQQLHESLKGQFFVDTQQFTSILDNKDISADNWVQIIDAYNGANGSLIKDTDFAFSLLPSKTDVMNSIADKLLESASKGNEDAIKVLCNEIHNGTAGMLGTADEFIDRIMNQANDDVLGKIVDKYSSYNDGASIYTDIKNDFSFGTEDNYLDILNAAYSRYQDTTEIDIDTESD